MTLTLHEDPERTRCWPGQRPLPLVPQAAALWGTPVGMEVEFAGPGTRRRR